MSSEWARNESRFTKCVLLTKCGPSFNLVTWITSIYLSDSWPKQIWPPRLPLPPLDKNEAKLSWIWLAPSVDLVLSLNKPRFVAVAHLLLCLNPQQLDGSVTNCSSEAGTSRRIVSINTKSTINPAESGYGAPSFLMKDQTDAVLPPLSHHSFPKWCLTGERLPVWSCTCSQSCSFAFSSQSFRATHWWRLQTAFHFMLFGNLKPLLQLNFLLVLRVNMVHRHLSLRRN